MSGGRHDCRPLSESYDIVESRTERPKLEQLNGSYHMKASRLGFLLTIIMLLAVAVPGWSADTEQSIRPGTVITPANWQNYKQDSWLADVIRRGRRPVEFSG